MVSQVVKQAARIHDVLEIPFHLRQRSRFRSVLQSGNEVGVVLPRGLVLRHGQLLASENGNVIQVRAAPESVSVVETRDPCLLARACYHLGNRHVELEICDRGVKYLQDSVLDSMVQQLGLQVQHRQDAFEPEVAQFSHHHSHD